ncbi:hypothetical protein HYV12_02290 [Candidatus Dojkabacteria bacterium]|nr:hypothetical protein [Candidatus Dojkabacteria bacterium]
MDNTFNLYISLIFILVILSVFVLATLSSKRISVRRKNEIYRQLKDIKGNIELNLTATNRDSVVRLDSILSKVMQIVKKNKLSSGENLKLVKSLSPRDLYEKLWYYHKLRNKIVHENIDITNEDAHKAYEVYYKFITKLLS